MVFNAMVITAAPIDSQAKRVRNKRFAGLGVMVWVDIVYKKLPNS
jgi:hypothetical protein